jgi:hypothetical protein
MDVEVRVTGDISELDLTRLPNGVSVEEQGADYVVLGLSVPANTLKLPLQFFTKPNFEVAADAVITFAIDSAVLNGLTSSGATRPAVTIPTDSKSVDVTVVDDDVSATAKHTRLVVVSDDMAHASVSMKPPHTEGMQVGEQVLFGAIAAAGTGESYGTLTKSSDNSELIFTVDGTNAEIAASDADDVFSQSFTYTVLDGLPLGDPASSTSLRESAPATLEVEMHTETRDGSLSFSDTESKNDYIILDGDAEAYVSAGGGEDTIIAGGGATSASGGSGDDSIVGGAGNDSIWGGAGNDTIYGGAGDDSIQGGSGNDLIYGDEGNNILYGNGGADTFAWRPMTGNTGKDQILDFSTEQGDKLNFNDLLEEDMSLTDFINSFVTSIDLTPVDSKLSFTINNGQMSKSVDITFDPTDDGYVDMLGQYNGASGSDQDMVLLQFLTTIAQ